MESRPASSYKIEFAVHLGSQKMLQKKFDCKGSILKERTRNQIGAPQSRKDQIFAL